jgi:hypothetical protein
MQAVEGRAVQLVDEFNPQGMANVLWALASMQHQPGEQALTTLSSRGVGRLAARFNSQNLANVVCLPCHSTMFSHRPSLGSTLQQRRRRM